MALTSFYIDFKEAAKAIGLPRENYRTHSLRATAATLLYLNCLDIYQVQRFLGHSNPEMTAKYIKNLLGDQALEETMKNSSKHWLKLVTTE